MFFITFIVKTASDLRVCLYVSLNDSYTQTALSVTNFAMFSLKIFQHQMAFLQNAIPLVKLLPLRKPHLYKSCLHFFFLGYHE